MRKFRTIEELKHEYSKDQCADEEFGAVYGIEMRSLLERNEELEDGISRQTNERIIPNLDKEIYRLNSLVKELLVAAYLAKIRLERIPQHVRTTSEIFEIKRLKEIIAKAEE